MQAERVLALALTVQLVVLFIQVAVLTLTERQAREIERQAWKIERLAKGRTTKQWQEMQRLATERALEAMKKVFDSAEREAADESQ